MTHHKFYKFIQHNHGAGWSYLVYYCYVCEIVIARHYEHNQKNVLQEFDDIIISDCDKYIIEAIHGEHNGPRVLFCEAPGEIIISPGFNFPSHRDYWIPSD